MCKFSTQKHFDLYIICSLVCSYILIFKFAYLLSLWSLFRCVSSFVSFCKIISVYVNLELRRTFVKLQLTHAPAWVATNDFLYYWLISQLHFIRTQDDILKNGGQLSQWSWHVWHKNLTEMIIWLPNQHSCEPSN